jgi:hypothetical protein
MGVPKCKRELQNTACEWVSIRKKTTKNGNLRRQSTDKAERNPNSGHKSIMVRVLYSAVSFVWHEEAKLLGCARTNRYRHQQRGRGYLATHCQRRERERRPEEPTLSEEPLLIEDGEGIDKQQAGLQQLIQRERHRQHSNAQCSLRRFRLVELGAGPEACSHALDHTKPTNGMDERTLVQKSENFYLSCPVNYGAPFSQS